jgi:tRNA(Glu) U13 pseudouridine synthase TruD
MSGGPPLLNNADVSSPRHIHILTAGLQIGDVEAGWPRPLYPGESQGNAFKLRARGVRLAVDSASGDEKEEEEKEWRGELERRLDGLKAHGFINFFGRQRLAAPATAGGSGPCAWEVGRALLRQDWDGLLRLLFGPRDGDWEVRNKRECPLS